MEPIVNIQDPAGKKVGRRIPADPLSLQGQTKRDKRAWQAAFARPFVPKGVFRFHSHEEADAWMTRMLARIPEKD